MRAAMALAALLPILLSVSAAPTGPLPSAPLELTGEAGWTVEPVAFHGGSAPPDLAVDSAGIPHVLYCPPGDARFASRTVSGWTNEHLVATPFGGICGNLALGPDDAPHVTTPYSLDLGCVAYGVRTGDNWDFSCFPGGVLDAVDSLGRPHAVTYWTVAPDRFDLRHLWREADGTWQFEAAEPNALTAFPSLRWYSMVLDSADDPHVLYYDSVRGDVRYAFRDGTGWHVEVVEHIGLIQYGGKHGSIVVDRNGMPRIAYLADVSFAENRASLRYAVRTISGWLVETLDGPPGMKGFFPNVLISPEGLSRVGFQDWGQTGADLDLRYGAFDGSSWTFETAYDALRVGVQFPTFAIDHCGNPHAAFYSNDDAGVMYATRGEPCGPAPDDPMQVKHEAIERIKALKEQAIARGDETFVHELDHAEEHVWKSLGYEHTFRPESIAVAPGADVTILKDDKDTVELILGPSWDARLDGYTAIRLTWSNGAVTVIDLPDKWPKKDVHWHEKVRVDAWEQDVHVDVKRDKKAGVEVKVHAHDASLDFSLSLDRDLVADFAFTYEVRPWWLDDTHLDPKHGKKVFDEEKKAVKHLTKRHGTGGNVTVWCRLDEGMWAAADRAALDAECDAIANLLVKADEVLVRVAIADAQETPIKDPKRAEKVQHEIDKALRELDKAYGEWDKLHYDHAIQRFKKAWEHAQHAIGHAGMG